MRAAARRWGGRDNVRRMRLPLALILAVVATGCVERRLRLESDPPGALVTLNGEEVARTPATVPLDWFGRYDVAARLDGHEPAKAERWVVAPWWLWPPFDLVAEVLPVRLTHTATIEVELRPESQAEPGLLRRATALRRATTRPAPR